MVNFHIYEVNASMERKFLKSNLTKVGIPLLLWYLTFKKSSTNPSNAYDKKVIINIIKLYDIFPFLTNNE